VTAAIPKLWFDILVAFIIVAILVLFSVGSCFWVRVTTEIGEHISDGGNVFRSRNSIQRRILKSLKQ
jgi:hypothetical protein